MPKQFLEAGKIVGTHGVRGDLRVQSWCDSPEVLCDFDLLYLDENTPVTVEKAQVHKNVVPVSYTHLISGASCGENCAAIRQASSKSAVPQMTSAMFFGL